ncbi:hypothetical protein BJG91_00225 (plasmid) [Bacillus thuringiensis]|nr:hypothetical protein BJG91_00225 [Bacillus thuringiensis]
MTYFYTYLGRTPIRPHYQTNTLHEAYQQARKNNGAPGIDGKSFADDIVITVSGHSSKRGWDELALRRLWEQLKPLGVELNLEKTRVVNVLKGESFGFLGFDLRRVLNQNKSRYFVLITPKKTACTKVKAKI